MNRENEQTRSIVSGINEYYKQTFGFNEDLISLVSECEDELAGDFARQEKIAEYWQARVLTAFQNARISDTHFGWNTGYGHNDQGREKTEEVFAGVFGTEKASEILGCKLYFCRRADLPLGFRAGLCEKQQILTPESGYAAGQIEPFFVIQK